MNLFRFLLLLGLIAAASATFGRRTPSNCRSRECGLTKRVYRRPNSNKCLGVFDFLAAGVNAKLGLVSEIFGQYSNVERANNINTAVDTCVNLSKGIAVILDRWLDGIGTIFQNMIMGISRLIFCVLGNPWQRGSFIGRWLTLGRSTAPVICNKDFGIRWGWRRYLRGYSNYDEIVEFYDLFNLRANIEKKIRLKFNTSVGSLKGTPKVIVDTLYKLCDLFERDFSSWKRNDFVLVTRYLITISGAVASSYKVESGVAVVDEYSEFLSTSFKTEYKVDITVYSKVIKEELSTCETNSLNGAFKDETNINVNVNIDESVDGDDDGGDDK